MMRLAVSVVMPNMTLAALTLPALADHNSKFGDNTGRTVAGVHDDRIDSNLKGSANSTAMGENTASVRSSGSLGSYAQSGAPETVDLEMTGISALRMLNLF